MFSFLVDYSVQTGLVKLSLDAPYLLLVSRSRGGAVLSGEFCIRNESLGVKLPYVLEVIRCDPAVKVMFNRMEGIIEEGKYHYISLHIAAFPAGFSSFVIRVRHAEVRFGGNCRYFCSAVTLPSKCRFVLSRNPRRNCRSAESPFVTQRAVSS